MVMNNRCTGCGACIEFCPASVLEFSDWANARGSFFPRVVKGREDRCLGCGTCEHVCPSFSIYSLGNNQVSPD